MLPNLIGLDLLALKLGTHNPHRSDRSVRPQDQPPRVRELQLERPGELVTRERLGLTTRRVAWRRMALSARSTVVAKPTSRRWRAWFAER
jgi:hypothetical protein